MSLIFPLFSYLHDIDDALHLARTCKGVYTVFDGYYARAWIFRCIIVSCTLFILLKTSTYLVYREMPLTMKTMLASVASKSSATRSTGSKFL